MYDNNYFSILISVAISVALFFIFRRLFLWYWKVDTIVKNQDVTNELLEKIYKQLEKSNDINNEKNSTEERITRLKRGLTSNQMIVKNTKTGDFKIQDKSQWATNQQMGGSKDFVIVYGGDEK